PPTSRPAGSPARIWSPAAGGVSGMTTSPLYPQRLEKVPLGLAADLRFIWVGDHRHNRALRFGGERTAGVDQRVQPIGQPIAALDQQNHVIFQRERCLYMMDDLLAGAVGTGAEPLYAKLRLTGAAVEPGEQLLQLRAVAPQHTQGAFQ